MGHPGVPGDPPKNEQNLYIIGTNLLWMIGSYDDLTTKELQSNYYQGTFYYQPYLYLACCMQLLCVNSCL